MSRTAEQLHLAMHQVEERQSENFLLKLLGWNIQIGQCEEVARIYTGMPVYTGILAKSPVFRPYFCDFTRIFVILCRLNALLCCLE